MAWVRWLAAASFSVLMLAGRAHAGPVYCGSVTCFQIKVAAGGRSAQARADRATDVLNKHLGGKSGVFTLRPRGSEVDILLNGDLLVTVTPADARAAGSKSARALAATWRATLHRAFEATKAQK